MVGETESREPEGREIVTHIRQVLMNVNTGVIKTTRREETSASVERVI